MALDTITITTADETGIDYVVTSLGGPSSVIRSDNSKALSTPRLLELSHQPGNQKTPDRHLARLTDTRQDTTDPSLFATNSVHVVFTAPRTIVTEAQLKELWHKMKVLIDDNFFSAFVRGGLG